ncbi:ATP-binding cassette domain-containing protein [Paenibacillus paeoniae]|uniref:ATP-binding cassette domain-containing protein n=1 Tax=Paenibacillus paeoniae TaxID=2292705 RepID=A0A371PEX3_9BACL|nr:ATP-binding cassette domain-containing protein [Paenibacillus paeoniae]REK74462.1 ATP-binding cassette domain-containing protein [Paenibacillus paeoniae]
MIDIRDTTFYYNMPQDDEEDAGRKPALSHISLTIAAGEFVAFLGRNGSGKSSLSRLLNGIELPTEGTVSVEGHVTSDKAALSAVRRIVQIVFQNPENQQVGITVGEDIAFGLSNIGWPQHDIANRVAWAINLVGLDADEDRPVSNLSGGEKQKLALAAVLALAPRCLILDEATSMLDPVARRQFVATLHEVRKQYPFTLIYITHHLEEVTDADRWLLFRAGKVVASGTPNVLAQDTRLLEDCGLELPYYWKLAGLLRESGISVPSDMNELELRELLCKSS